MAAAVNLPINTRQIIRRAALPHSFLVSVVALITWLLFCGARMHHDSMYGMESEHGTLILPYQLHVGLSCSTLYNTRTMVGFFRALHYITHERWLTRC